jgi:branched-chain amino acid transport system substrate-binding protein
MRRSLAGVVLALALVSAACGSSADKGRALDAAAARPADSGAGAAPVDTNSAPPAEAAPADAAPAAPAAASTAGVTPAAGAASTGAAAPAPKAGTAAPAPAAGGSKAAAGAAPGVGSGSAPVGGGAKPGGGTKAGEAPAPVPGGGPGSATPAPAPSGPKADIVVGSFGIESGPLGAVFQVGLNAAKAWVADVNARGGLGGHRIRFVDIDDGGDSNRALAAAKHLVEEEGAAVIFGERAVTTLPAVTKYLESRNVPVVGDAGNSPAADSSPMVFTPQFSATVGTGWAHIAAVPATGKKKLALFYCSEVLQCKTTKDYVKEVAPKVGLQVVYEAQISIAQPDYTAEVIAARNAGAEVIVNHADGATLVRIIRSAHRQGYNPLMSANHTAHSESVLKNGGNDVEGTVVGASTADWANSPLMADYREATAKYAPGGERGSIGAQIWVAGKLLEKIAAGFPAKVSASDILNGLYSLRGETLGGITPPLTFPKGPHGDVNWCAVPVAIKGGKFAPLQTAETFSCAPGWKPIG